MKPNNSVIKKSGAVEYITFPNLNNVDFIIHAVSTRHGGKSALEYTSTMNLGFKTDDDFEIVQENYRIFSDVVGFTYENIVHANQTHSSNIRIVSSKDSGKGLFKERDYNDVDGLITNEKNIPLAILTADCVPVLYCDVKNKVIGAAHCGWRGTYSLLQKKMIDKMKSEFGTEKKDLKIAIAPCVQSCCYEVSEELYYDFKKQIPYLTKEIFTKNNEYYLDLSAINKSVLINSGVPEENIFVSDICTCCNHKDLFSQRVMGFKRGMIASIIEIKE